MIKVTVLIQNGDVETDEYPNATLVTEDKDGMLRLYRVRRADMAGSMRIPVAGYPAGRWVRWWLGGEEASDVTAGDE